MSRTRAVKGAPEADEAQRIERELQSIHGRALVAQLTDAYNGFMAREARKVMVETTMDAAIFFAAGAVAHLWLEPTTGGAEPPPWEDWKALALADFARQLDAVRAHCTCGPHR